MQVIFCGLKPTEILTLYIPRDAYIAAPITAADGRPETIVAAIAAQDYDQLGRSAIALGRATPHNDIAGLLIVNCVSPTVLGTVPMSVQQIPVQQQQQAGAPPPGATIN